ncbi:hypothetical protein LZC95_06570 [Pendulispora brunnea]|uniref:Uncharacterized protein n=1 Tax=Pendulispora brunnea TaxID=2905690 RepID=A0ABZ2KG58_9BACT
MRFVRSSIAVLVCLLVGCSSAADPESSEPTDVQVQENVTEQAKICPLKWTCDDVSFYGTRLQCEGSCGSEQGCYRTYACNGSCICP